jgi:hypothetical protein
LLTCDSASLTGPLLHVPQSALHELHVSLPLQAPSPQVGPVLPQVAAAT